MLYTRLCDLFEIAYPVINAPMGGSATADLAAAVSAAGGLGLIGGTSAGGAGGLRGQIRAAGGIADGRGLAAVLMLGAAGAWIGTRFVASREWGGSAWARESVVAAGTDDTVLTRAYDLATEAPFPAGITHRVVRNDFTDAWHGRDAEVIARRVELREQLQAAEASGDTRIASVSAGSAAGLVHAVEPAGEILRRIVADAERILRERPAQVLRP